MSRHRELRKTLAVSDFISVYAGDIYSFDSLWSCSLRARNSSFLRSHAHTSNMEEKITYSSNPPNPVQKETAQFRGIPVVRPIKQCSPSKENPKTENY